MKIIFAQKPRGIALMIVMIAIFVLSVIAGAFAYAMKVETKLAMNAGNDDTLLWLGRSGVELARYALAMRHSIPGEPPYDALNQQWAGGPGSFGSSNSPLAEISLANYQVGAGTVSIKITDLERKANINMADQAQLQQGLTLVGVDASEIDSISSSILDWIDPDDQTHMNGTESDYYQTLNPPYFAKNKPMDDMSELLFVRGVTPDMYWGSSSTNHTPAAFQEKHRAGRPNDTPVYPVGLVDVFTALSSGKININTASLTTLQVIPGIDQNAAAQIIKLRSGPDGVDGTEDDTPFANVGEAAMAVNPQLQQQLARYGDVVSQTFDVQVDANLGGYHRTYYATLGQSRNSRTLQILSFYWK
jgi:general secretion pathway protein K